MSNELQAGGIAEETACTGDASSSSSSPSLAAAPASRLQPQACAERAVLCVDDEANILSSMKRLLRKEDYRLLTAPSGPEGLDLLERETVQLVISDQRMPGMTGVEFLQKVKEHYPDIIRCVLSGYADAGLIVDSINKGEIFRFLTKPWNDEELKVSIRQCFEHYDIVKQNHSLLDQVRRQNQELKTLNERLEEIVNARTRSLQTRQEILEQLPLPVVGVSPEGWLVTSNAAAREALPELGNAPPGTDASQVFPQEFAAMLKQTMNEGTLEGNCCFNWTERHVTVQVRPLNEGGSLRGCILVLESSNG